MKVFKVRDKDSGLFMSNHYWTGFNSKGSTWENLGHAKAAITCRNQHRASKNYSLEVVIFELTEVDSFDYPQKNDPSGR